MSRRALRCTLLIAPVLLSSAALSACDPTRPVPPATVPDPATPVIAEVGRYTTGLGPGSAEISAYEAGRAYVVNATANALDIVDLTDPSAPSLVERVDLSAYGAGINSVDVHDGIVAAAVQADPKTDPGSVVFLTTDGDLIAAETVGALPDMVTFTPDGRYVLTADEGEPNDAYTIDPQGTVSIVDVAAATTPTSAGAPVTTVRTVDFTAFDAPGALSADVRVYGPGASASEDLEPEYVAVDPESATAYVTLQENNAVAVIDIATAAVTRIDPLGTKDHMVAGNGLDPSDRDSAITIAARPVWGLFQPDAIAVADLAGGRYYLTANEGDTRAYPGYSEELRVGNAGYVLAPEVFGTTATGLKANSSLGRLTASKASGDFDKDGDFEQIQVPGGRSFTIRDAATGKRVWDSGQQFEDLTAAIAPSTFNSDTDATGFDTRSDNKGPEPEAITVGRIDGRDYAFIGLERSGGVMVYDVTDPRAPAFRQWIDPVTDQAPEQIEFVPAADSPTGTPLLLVANEVSGTLAIYQAVVTSGPAS